MMVIIIIIIIIIIIDDMWINVALNFTLKLLFNSRDIKPILVTSLHYPLPLYIIRRHLGSPQLLATEVVASEWAVNYLPMYIYIYIYLCVCVCVCVFTKLCYLNKSLDIVLFTSILCTAVRQNLIIGYTLHSLKFNSLRVLGALYILQGTHRIPSVLWVIYLFTCLLLLPV